MELREQFADTLLSSTPKIRRQTYQGLGTDATPQQQGNCSNFWSQTCEIARGRHGIVSTLSRALTFGPWAWRLKTASPSALELTPKY